MIKSVAGNYIVNIDADILYQVWLNVVKAVTELQFDITVTMTDGHKSNVRLFKEKLWWIYEDVDTESVVPR